ncbi:MAG TPA: hypothetical protein VF721_07560, partial [Pyrinomonadaceae bacterium]
MVSAISLQSKTPTGLEHQLNDFFPELLKFDSTKEMEKSAIYQEIKPEVERILNAVVEENFAPLAQSEPPAVAGGFNIESRNLNAKESPAKVHPPA